MSKLHTLKGGWIGNEDERAEKNKKGDILYPNDVESPQNSKSSVITNAEEQELNKLEDMDQQTLLPPDVRARLYHLRDKQRHG